MNDKEETPPTAIPASASSDSSDNPNKATPPLVNEQTANTDRAAAEADDALNSRPSFGSVSTIPGSSPPDSPSHSPSHSLASPKSPNSPRPSAHHYPSSVKTPQMMVLGKDGSDYRDLMASRSKQTNNERQQALLEGEGKEENETFEDEIEEGTSWWNRLWHGKPKHINSSTDSAEDQYTSMDHTEQQQKKDRRRPPQNSDIESQVYYQGLGEDPLQSPPPPTRMNHQSILRNLPLPSTREEQIQQDCSFLYRPVDDNNGNPRRTRRTLRAILDPPPAGVSTLYQDAQEVWSPPVMAQYKAKYQQLNEVYEVQDTHDRFADYNDYAVTPPRELTLEEQQEENAQRALIASVAKSSLFYQHEANGRVMLRLPRDHVRLMVANPGDLEPGILSVIQNRREDDPIAPTLQYCLTVPSNLYQKVISEMVHYSSPAHGLDSSFYASDHADIRWAIGIMGIIMLVLGINTLCFGLD